MSEIKVNKLTPRTNCGTVTLGDSGDTFTIPAGATINNLGTASGFGATGAVNWDVSSIKTTGFTAVSGNGYFVDTATTGAVTVTLPAAPSVGDVVGVADYADNFGTANCIFNRNSLKIGGVAADATLTTNGVAVTLVYVDVTKGWIVTDSGNQSDAPTTLFVTGTGGCITTSGDYKMHTFLSPGTFSVTCAGNPSGSTTVDYLIVAGGGGGGFCIGGGGGAGGVRGSNGTASGCYTAGPSPMVGPISPSPVSATPGAYAIVVGGGGTGASTSSPPGNATDGGVSTFNSISSAGGGAGGSYGRVGAAGGSGGGAGGWTPYVASPGTTGGAGNTPPAPTVQGMAGGDNPVGTQDSNGAGGGGATVAGSNSFGCPGRTHASPNAAGLTSSITASPVEYGNGGRGLGDATPGGAAGGCNTGDGGDGEGSKSPGTGNNGGSGIVIIRYKYQ